MQFLLQRMMHKVSKDGNVKCILLTHMYVDRRSSWTIGLMSCCSVGYFQISEPYIWKGEKNEEKQTHCDTPAHIVQEKPPEESLCMFVL